MKRAWAASIARRSAAALGALRGTEGVLALDDGERLWIRGSALDDATDAVLRSAPGLARFALYSQDAAPSQTKHARRAGVATGDDLFAWPGGRVPIGRIPAGRWCPLVDAVGLERTAPALPARLERRVELRLIRGGTSHTPPSMAPAAMLCPLERFVRWVVRAPAVRLEPLELAVSSRGEAFVRGAPLPPIAATAYLDELDGIVTPTGTTWLPAVDAATLRAALGLEPGAVALLRVRGDVPLEHAAAEPPLAELEVEVIEKSGLVRVTRSAARATLCAPDST